ncbi:MAG: NADH-quinone oxidoreductase subunit N [Parachlamydiaceae bacterium]|nr:NADH-quinone oxidoreductase subunit N [Parachlamydiaceae bacterium]
MISSLNSSDIFAISPVFILLAGGLILILLESFFPSTARKTSFPIAIATLVLAGMAVAVAPVSANPLLTNWLYFDPLARFFALLFILIALGSTFLSVPFFKRFDASKGEYFFLLFSAVIGLLMISAAADFLTLFIGIETLSLSLYILCGYIKKWDSSREASTKYFFNGALAAAFLLYGIALIYGATGTTRFDGLLGKYQAIGSAADQALFLGGAAFITLGIAFKAAIFPVHAWAPDVYDGAPTPITAFMSVATKAGAFAAFIRIFMGALPEFNPLWNQGTALLVYPTLLYANTVALCQTQLRRFFAYSSIANAGFLLIPVASGGPDAISALLFYLVVYTLATLTCFAILAFFDDKEEGVLFKDLKGLYRRSPVLALIFSLALLTLGGIPPTAGFLAKFYLFKVAFQAKAYGLVVVGLLATILSVFYYLRIIALMFTKEESRTAKLEYSYPAMGVGIFGLVAIAFLSIYPEPFLSLLAGL